MNWREHSEIDGQHAFLSGSNYHWLNYSEDHLIKTWMNLKSKEEGIALHEFASIAIKRRIKLAKTKNTLHMFVNDCIGYNMKSEQMLYYSENAFGTADAISFKNMVLRISDYKSGSVRASFKQLDIYAALFCLEYNIDPLTIVVEERIYQNNECVESSPDPEYIIEIMKTIVEFDTIIERLKLESKF